MNKEKKIEEILEEEEMQEIIDTNEETEILEEVEVNKSVDSGDTDEMIEEKVSSEEKNEAAENLSTEEILDANDSEISTDEEIGNLKKEVEEWKNAYLRKQADFQNFTKRKEKELSDLRAFASEKIITKLLDSVDNLERAVISSTESKDFDGLFQGVTMILGHLKNLMQSEGVGEVKCEGEKYDPTYHHAVMVEDDPNTEADTIIAELQKGYTMKGKVIRPSMVKVCKRS